MNLSIGFHKKFKYVKFDKNMHNSVVFLWNMTSFTSKKMAYYPFAVKKNAKNPTDRRVFDNANRA